MASDEAETAKIVTVAEGFFVRQAVDNIAWIDMGDFALVVDALEQPELEEEVASARRSSISGPNGSARTAAGSRAHGGARACCPCPAVTPTRTAWSGSPTTRCCSWGTSSDGG